MRVTVVITPFAACTQALALESSIGPFDFYIRGVMNAWKPEEAALDFQFNKVDIHFNGSKVRVCFYPFNPHLLPNHKADAPVVYKAGAPVSYEGGCAP